MSNQDGDIEPRSCPTCKRTPVPSGPFDDCACGHQWNKPPTKAQGVDPACQFCALVHERISVLADEAKCRDRVDQALQYLNLVRETHDRTYGEVDTTLREILTGARDMKSIHSSGRKGPGVS